MSSKPVFVVTHTDQTKVPATMTSYFCRNWTMTVSDNQMQWHGDFLPLHVPNPEWVGAISAQVGTVFQVKLGGQRDEEIMQEAEDFRRIDKLAAHLVGLTETLIDKHLPQEFKMILERTPDVARTLGGLMNDGIKKALDKMGKGK